MGKIKLSLQFYGSPILRKKAGEVKEIDFQIRDYLDEMFRFMKVHQGVGLAANQAGLDLRILTIDIGRQKFKVVNPKIIRKSGSIVFNEGCLSFPGINLDIKRANEVWVEFLDENNKEKEIHAQGLLSVVFQHEIDHLNGVLFIDRVSLWRRLSIKRQLDAIKEMSKRKENNGVKNQVDQARKIN